MRQEAARKLAGVRSEFVGAVEDVLSDEQGLSALSIRRHIHRHPDYDLEIPMKYLHSWLYFVSDDVGFHKDWSGAAPRYYLDEERVEQPLRILGPQTDQN